MRDEPLGKEAGFTDLVSRWRGPEDSPPLTSLGLDRYHILLVRVCGSALGLSCRRDVDIEPDWELEGLEKRLAYHGEGLNEEAGAVERDRALFELLLHLIGLDGSKVHHSEKKPSTAQSKMERGHERKGSAEWLMHWGREWTHLHAIGPPLELRCLVKLGHHPAASIDKGANASVKVRVVVSVLLQVVHPKGTHGNIQVGAQLEWLLCPKFLGEFLALCNLSKNHRPLPSESDDKGEVNHPNDMAAINVMLR